MNNEFIINNFNKSIIDNSFVKLTFSKIIDNQSELKNVYIRQILINNKLHYSFTYRHTKRDIVKNYQLEQCLEQINSLINSFANIRLFCLNADYVIENNKTYILKASYKTIPSLEHDISKKRIIEAEVNKNYLKLLNITDSNGKVLAKSQSKYKQINNYIEILSPLLKNLKKDNCYNIADMGSGKAYLSFALYDYLVNTLGIKIKMNGVENRNELVELCNNYAKTVNFNDLEFINSNIIDYNNLQIDILIALHACNTATDDAIIKGIQSNAELIVVAPCCHHQIRENINKNNKLNNDDIFNPILKHGIFLERQAELLTDTIRCLILEYFEYKTKVVEFISDAHTHKNIMIIASKNKITQENKTNILNKINNLKNTFGITEHYLEKIIST